MMAGNMSRFLYPIVTSRWLRFVFYALASRRIKHIRQENQDDIPLSKAGLELTFSERWCETGPLPQPKRLLPWL